MKFDSYRYEVWCPFVQKAYHCSVEAEMWIKCKVNAAPWNQAMPLQLTQQAVSATVKWHYHLFPSSAWGSWAEKAFLISWERISEQESLEGLCLAEAGAQGKGRKPSCTTKALGWSLRSLRLSRWLLREPGWNVPAQVSQTAADGQVTVQTLPETPLEEERGSVQGTNGA